MECSLFLRASAATLITNCLLAAAPSFATGSKPPASISAPTSAQLACRQQAPSTPKRVVIGFDGLWGYDGATYKKLKAMTTRPSPDPGPPPGHGALLMGLIAKGAMQVDDVEWSYYAEDSIGDSGLQDVVRCAYELATKPYDDGTGGKVYSTLTILGFSFGGHASYQMVNQLHSLGIATNLVVTTDARAKNGSIDFVKPDFVGRWANFHEHDSWLPGQIVDGAEVNQDLSYRFTGQHYDHQGMPGSIEALREVRADLAALTTCRRDPQTAKGDLPLNCP